VSMIKRGGKHLYLLLAILLILLAFAIVISLFFLRSSDEDNFDELISSAELALQNDSIFEFNRQLLRASKEAAVSADWMKILSLASESIPKDARPSDYRLFTLLAGRAASVIAGNENFLAYWLWGLLRSDNLSKASKHAQSLSGGKWSSVAAEIRLKTLPKNTDDRIKRFVSGDYDNSDPELFARVALLTESAELSYDAALLYMLNGELEKAYDMALILMNEDLESTRRWSDRSLPVRKNVYTALAEIAVDAGYKDSAIRWLSLRLEDARRRRIASWQNLELLGELYWEIYNAQEKTEYRDLARNVWNEALELVSSDNESPDSWRVWINLSTLEETTGNLSRSKEILDEALRRFPDQNEVKAAWARRHFSSEPALARRLIRQSAESGENPILGITAIAIDPEIVSSRLYETRLWELFEMVTSGENRVHETDARIIAAFLLEFMSLRRNYSSIDIAIERYQKSRPHETWILAWRLAVDAARKAGLINLIAPKQGKSSPYDDFRRAARLQNSWQLLHDSALFAILASAELNEEAKIYPDAAGGEFPELFEAAALDALERDINAGRIVAKSLVDRIELVKKNRDDLVKKQRGLRAYGKKGIEMQTQAGAALRQKAETLTQNALEDLVLAEEVAGNLPDVDRSALLYLRAVVLRKIGKNIESRNMAEEAIALNPDNTRVREFLGRFYDHD